jgi:hypothetical protein
MTTKPRWKAVDSDTDLESKQRGSFGVLGSDEFECSPLGTGSEEHFKTKWKLDASMRADLAHALSSWTGLLSRIETFPAQSVVVPINTFAPLPIVAILPIQVVVQNSDDEFVASFFDANISASGKTVQIAVDNLKDLIFAQYQHLEGKAESDLGKARKRQKSVLMALLKKGD